MPALYSRRELQRLSDHTYILFVLGRPLRWLDCIAVADGDLVFAKDPKSVAIPQTDSQTMEERPFEEKNRQHRALSGKVLQEHVRVLRFWYRAKYTIDDRPCPCCH